MMVLNSIKQYYSPKERPRYEDDGEVDNRKKKKEQERDNLKFLAMEPPSKLYQH